MAIDLKSGCFYFERGPVGLFRFSGPDHLRYLHNRLTQDIKSLSAGGGVKGLCLTPNGRIQANLLILKGENSIDILSGELLSKEVVSEVKSSLLQFKVADQVECQDLSEGTSQLTLIGSGLNSLGMMLGINTNDKERYSHCSKEFDGATIRLVINSIIGIEALEIIGPTEATNQLKAMSSMFGVKELEATTKELLRILDRDWKFGVDADDKTLAAEINLDEIVSFKKGCYPGQEVVEMSISRGRPNRSLELLVAEGKTVVGSEVQLVGKSVGSVTSSIYLEEREQSFFLSRLKTDALTSNELMVEGRGCRIITKEESHKLLV